MKIFRAHLLLPIVIVSTTIMTAKTVIFPVEAVDDLWVLPASEFQQKYAGINITGLGVSDEGWYVRYRHENLTLFFGPLPDRDAVRKKMWELEAVRDAAIRNRPSLSSSQVDFVKFSYSGVYGARGDTPYGGSSAEDGKNGAGGDLDGDGIPNAKDGDMDGDGVSNAEDSDADGDGVGNDQDDYPYGKAGGKEDSGDRNQGGSASRDGAQGTENQGGSQGREGEQLAALNRGQQQNGQGGQTGTRSPSAQVGQQGQTGQQSQKSAQRSASNSRLNQGGQPGQAGQAGQPGQPSRSQSNQRGQQGQPGQPTSGPPSSSGQPGQENPLIALLRRILGL